MKQILLFGAGPLPNEKSCICSAANLRTQQFLDPLRDKHRVKLFLIGGDDEEGNWKDDRTFQISRQSPSLFSQAKDILSKDHFDIVIGVNTFPSYVAAKSLDEKTPFWADLNGWIMAEMQAQSHELHHNHFLARGWEQEKCILKRADQISTVSSPQRFATFGELASLGRLNKEHFQENFVHVIPNAAQIPQTAIESSTSPLLNLPKEAFLITQIGGFNNWVDEKTLFQGVEGAMKEDETLHFASTGGVIQGVAESVFERFQKRVSASPYSDRFHLLGWIEPENIPKLYQKSDIGIMTDSMCLETETGARNRLNEMMAYELPVITTKGSEIAHNIAKWECGHVVESGNSEEIKKSILSLRNNESMRSEFSRKSQGICRTILQSEETLLPLLQWLKGEDQKLLHKKRTSLKTSNLQGGLHYLKKQGLRPFLKKICQKISSS